MKFRQWLEQEETNVSRENNPLTDIRNAVLFGVEHGMGVVFSGDNDPAIATAKQLNGAIWFEGQELEPVVQQFVERYGLGILPSGQPRQQSSWEPTTPQKMSQDKFKQGNLLTSIFGGNNEQEKAQQMLGHPSAKQLFTTKRNPTILDVLNASSTVISNPNTISKYQNKQVQGGEVDEKGNAVGWWNWSSNTVSKQAIQQLLQLVANDPKLHVFNQMLNRPANEKSMTNFIKIGRQWGFNNPRGAFGELQSQVNQERDLKVIDLMKRQGGIFFAGSDHVGNVRRLLQNKQQGAVQ